MSIQKIIQEAINKNPRDLKETLEGELRGRMALALEAKMSDEEDDDEEDDDSSEEDLDEEVEQMDESWSDGISSRNAHAHASTAAKYRKKANDSATIAKRYDKDSPERNKHMADYHSAMAKSIKSSYHAGQYGSQSDAKPDHKEHMTAAKEYRAKSNMSEEVELDESEKKLASLQSKINALQDRYGLARERRKMSGNRQQGSTEIKIQSKIDDLRNQHRELERSMTTEAEELDETEYKYKPHPVDQVIRDKLRKAKVSYRDPNAKTAREEDRIAKMLAAKAKMQKEEAEELDELSSDLLKRYMDRSTSSGNSTRNLKAKSRANSVLGNKEAARALKDKAQKRADHFAKAMVRGDAQDGILKPDGTRTLGGGDDPKSNYAKAIKKMPSSYYKKD